MADTCRADLVELSAYAWHRLERRLAGLTDAEYRWTPVPVCRSVRARPDGTSAPTAPPGQRPDRVHHARLAAVPHRRLPERGPHRPWLGGPGDPGTAADALAALDAACACGRDILDGTTESSLAAPIGPLADHYGTASRRSFVLHVLDELIHHGAEVALLRDLNAASTPEPSDPGRSLGP
jgi:hypothetical protein